MPPQPWSPGQASTLPLDPSDAAGPPVPPLPPHGAWSPGATGFDPHALVSPKRRVGPIVAGVAGLLALVLGVAWIFSTKGAGTTAEQPSSAPSAVGQPGGAPSGQPTPGGGTPAKPAPTIRGISCEALAPTTAAPQTTAGRVSAGGLSYPQPGGPWPAPVTSDFAFPLVASGAVQMVQVADYGTSGWAAGLVIAELRQDPKITSVQSAARAAADCLVATQYTVAEYSEKRTRDEATTVDGASAWTIESTISLSDPDLAVTSEHMTLVMVETKPGRYAMFWSSIPRVTPDFTTVADACRTGLKVD